MTLIALVGMITHSLPGDQLVIILGLIAGVGGFGAGAHLAAAERVRATTEFGLLLKGISQAPTTGTPAQP